MLESRGMIGVTGVNVGVGSVGTTGGVGINEGHLNDDGQFGIQVGVQVHLGLVDHDQLCVGIGVGVGVTIHDGV